MRGTRRPRAYDPVAGRGQVAALALELRGVALDPEAEHVAVALAGQQAVELHAREHHEAVARRRLAPVPVVGERDDVVARTPVVAGERSGRQLTVRVAGVGVKRRPQPVPEELHGKSIR